eukprot:CAMPEP_0178465910 /NCGR_PEP_ID=MMETSP0689_2-20121128/51617_1 /TAXON_ID=160604 /ORGANISM="Amphidinium massartii, Strain CS-259" /LENGTH=649 /DNA_ID=CAMNT_0020092889 /DNA_START=39 /DNA_END=1986 /DNA_ORIENTATION=-
MPPVVARSRDVYRAVYMAAPLKFCTSLSPYDKVVPQYFIGPWQKDAHAFHRWKWRKMIERKRGPFTYTEGPLEGWRGKDYPDPGLIGATDLAAVAMQASHSGMEDPSFWHRVAERCRVLRDVMSAGDLVDIIDALVNVNYRHVDLMRLLARELKDDVDKLDLREAAVAANAYAHFRCHSDELLSVLSGHIAHQLRYAMSSESQMDSIDLQAIGIVAKAFMTLSYGNEEVFLALQDAAVLQSASMKLTDIVRILEFFSTMKQPFSAPQEWWDDLSAKVASSSVDLLGRTLKAMAAHNAASPILRQAIVSEVSAVLEEGLASLELEQGMGLPRSSSEVNNLALLSGASSSGGPLLPAFAKPPVPRQLQAMPHSHLAAQRLMEEAPSSSAATEFAGFEVSDAGPAMGGLRAVATDEVEAAFQLEEQGQESPVFEERELLLKEAEPSARWYNGSTRRPFGVIGNKRPKGFGAYSPDIISKRNRRGAQVVVVLDALSDLWQLDGREVPDRSEVELVQAAAPVIAATAPGLTAQQLASSAEVLAKLVEVADAETQFSTAASSASAAVPAEAREEGQEPQAQAKAVVPLQKELAEEALHTVVREGVRKLSNFGIHDLRRLHAAAVAVNVQDPYFERARFRKFPKVFRKELREGVAP